MKGARTRQRHGAHDADTASRGMGRVRYFMTPTVAVILLVIVVLIAGVGVLRASGTPLIGSEDGSRLGAKDSVSDQIPQSDLEPPTSAGRNSPGYGLVGGSEDMAADTIFVHVVGAVAAPGVVELPVGSRVVDAIASAGGVTPDADTGAVNLAAFATDGAQVYVPNVGEGASAAALGPSGGSASLEGGTGCVDLNTATALDLESLDGVGPKLAARIIEWRTGVGAIASADDLVAVPGIGAVLVSRIKAGTCQ